MSRELCVARGGGQAGGRGEATKWPLRSPAAMSEEPGGSVRVGRGVSRGGHDVFGEMNTTPNNIPPPSFLRGHLNSKKIPNNMPLLPPPNIKLFGRPKKMIDT